MVQRNGIACLSRPSKRSVSYLVDRLKFFIVSPMRIGLAFSIVAFAASTAHSQTGTFVGTVARDSAGTAVGQAEVQIPQLKLSTTTNYQGEFRFSNVPAGRFAVTVRAVGFEPLVDSIAVITGAVTDGDIVLTPLPVNLAKVDINEAPKNWISSDLNDFEARMKSHNGGSFLGDAKLSATTNHSLGRLIESEFPNLRVFGEYLMSGRDRTKGVLLASSTPCLPRLYVDGMLRYDPSQKGSVAPDLIHEDPSLYSGVEFYADGASMPARFNATGSGCGALLLWSRERMSRP